MSPNLTDPQPLRVGIIGGGWPGRRHAEGFTASGLWDVAAIADSDPSIRAAFAAFHPQASAFASAEAILADPAIDAVVVALPTYLHRPVVIAALEAGKHVLCEKPPALHAQEVTAMIATAEETGRILAFSLQRRALPAVAAARALIEAGRLGKIYHGRAVWTRPYGAPRGTGSWHADPARSGGGPLIDLGVHVLDLAWWLMGRPQVMSVSAVTHHRGANPGQVEDAAFGLVRLTGGRSIQLETSWVMHRATEELRIELAGTTAGLVIEPEALALVRAEASGLSIEKPTIIGGWPEALQRPFVEQARNFAAAINNGASPLTPAEDGLLIMRLIDGLYRSAREGKEMAIEPTGS